MKGKMLITGVAVLSIAALFGCQQQGATTVQPETKTSTATLQINPPTQQSTTANVEITGATGAGAAGSSATTAAGTSTSQQSPIGAAVEGNTRDLLGVFMKDGKMMTMTNGGTTGTMSADMTMADGSVVTMSGKVMINGGGTMMMKEGDAMLMSGSKVTTQAMMGMTK